MGYVTVNHEAGFAVSAEKGLWLYLVLAFPLMASTMAALVLFELVGNRKQAISLETGREGWDRSASSS